VPFDEDGSKARFSAWLDQWRARLHELGVDSVEYFRLRHLRQAGRLRWWAEQEGRAWDGVDVPSLPPPSWDDGVFPTRPVPYGEWLAARRADEAGR
jgi:hypothetical protein